MSDDGLPAPSEVSGAGSGCGSGTGKGLGSGSGWGSGNGEQDLVEIIRREAEMILSEVPPESRTEELVVDTVLKVVQTRIYSGPYPSATMLAELKEVDASLPNRAMSFAEREQEFRHEMGRKEMQSANREQWHAFSSRTIGQFLAVFVIVSIVGVVTYLSVNDKDVNAFSQIITALAVLTGVIITTNVVKQTFLTKDRPGESSDA